MTVGRGTLMLPDAGELHLEHVPDPGALNNWSFTIPAGQIWRITGIKQRCIFAAGAFNRDCTILFSLGGNVFNGVGNSGGVRIGNGTTLIYHQVNNRNYNTTGSSANAYPLPEMFLPPGTVIDCYWTNLAGADAVDEVLIKAERWRS